MGNTENRQYARLFFVCFKWGGRGLPDVKFPSKTVVTGTGWCGHRAGHRPPEKPADRGVLHLHTLIWGQSKLGGAKGRPGGERSGCSRVAGHRAGSCSCELVRSRAGPASAFPPGKRQMELGSQREAFRLRFSHPGWAVLAVVCRQKPRT